MGEVRFIMREPTLDVVWRLGKYGGLELEVC
jgi:hypothetical protein